MYYGRHAEFGCGDVRVYIPADFVWVCIYVGVSPGICLRIYTRSLHVCVYIFTYIHTASVCMCTHLRICTRSLHVGVYIFTYRPTDITCVCV